jgi:hypothetical protein
MDAQDFERLAETIADSLINNGTSLNESIIQSANSRQLSPEQIKRLVEFSNRAAFQKYYKDEKNRSDMEFDVADTDEILDKIYKDDSPEPESDEDTDGDPFADLADKHMDLKKDIDSLSVKKEEDEEDEDEEEEGEEKEAQVKVAELYPRAIPDKLAFELKQLPKLEKTAQELLGRILTTEDKYMDKLGKLGEVFKLYYDPVDYDSFEKMATHHGEESLMVLRDLRKLTGRKQDAPLALDKQAYYQVKTANEAEAQNLFKEALDLNKQQIDNIDGMKYINEKISEVKKWLHR